MAHVIEWFFYLLIPASILVHLFVSPYTKVEESFNIQAIHDIILHGLPWKGDAANFFEKNYDHVSFPGSVPRTFAGALGLAGIVKPFVGYFGVGDGDAKRFVDLQIFVRGVLGLINATALISFAKSVRKVFGVNAGIWYALLQASQFHVIYYASRTLPNMFALVFTTMALKALLDASPLPVLSRGKYRMCLFLLTVAGVVFRSELAILVATTTLYLFLNGRLSIFRDIIPAGLGGLIAGLLITVPVDSFFWQSFPLWPEWTAFYYNTIQGHSADWGVSPWHFYFTSALPRLMLNPMTYLLCIPFAVMNPALRPRSLDLIAPIISFVAIYSILPHKETRFIIYIIPGLTGVASAGASWLWTRRSKSFSFSILSLALVASVLLSFLASTSLLLISSVNYPGGQALSELHDRTLLHNRDLYNHGEKAQRHYHVYLDNLATQTGVTRFLEDHSTNQSIANADDPLSVHLAQESVRRWTYDKTEDPIKLLDPLFWEQFDWLLMEKPEKAIGKWDIVYTIYGYDGIRVLRPRADSGTRGLPWKKVKHHITERKLWRHSSTELFTQVVGSLWRSAEEKLRDRVLMGWWVKIAMEPKIVIMTKLSSDTSRFFDERYPHDDELYYMENGYYPLKGRE